MPSPSPSPNQAAESPPAVAPYSGAAIAPSAAKLVLLTVLASFLTKYGELALGGHPRPIPIPTTC